MFVHLRMGVYSEESVQRDEWKDYRLSHPQTFTPPKHNTKGKEIKEGKENAKSPIEIERMKGDKEPPVSKHSMDKSPKDRYWNGV